MGRHYMHLHWLVDNPNFLQRCSCLHYLIPSAKALLVVNDGTGTEEVRRICQPQVPAIAEVSCLLVLVDLSVIDAEAMVEQHALDSFISRHHRYCWMGLTSSNLAML